MKHIEITFEDDTWKLFVDHQFIAYYHSPADAWSDVAKYFIKCKETV